MRVMKSMWWLNMRNINLKIVGYLKNVKFEQDKRVYDSNFLARAIKTNGGGQYLVYEQDKDKNS